MDAGKGPMPNKRNRNDIHPGDAVRLEHTLSYGRVITETGAEPEDKITVKMNDGAEITGPRRRFVPVIER